MGQSWVLVGLLVGGIACLPALVRWLQAQRNSNQSPVAQGKVISALAVGPQQRVVTVRVGAAESEVTMILGVTPGSIQCLHKWESAAPAGGQGRSDSDAK